MSSSLRRTDCGDSGARPSRKSNWTVSLPATRGLPPFFRQAFPGLSSDAQRCLQFARSTPGLTSALCGMRGPEHVDENLALLAHPPAEPALIEALFAAARKRDGATR